MGFKGVARDANDQSIRFCKRLDAVTKLARLSCATGSHVFRVKLEYQLFTFGSRR